VSSKNIKNLASGRTLPLIELGKAQQHQCYGKSLCFLDSASGYFGTRTKPISDWPLHIDREDMAARVGSNKVLKYHLGQRYQCFCGRPANGSKGGVDGIGTIVPETYILENCYLQIDYT